MVAIQTPVSRHKTKKEQARTCTLALAQATGRIIRCSIVVTHFRRQLHRICL